MYDHSTLLALFGGLLAAHLAVAWLARRDGPVTATEQPERLDDGRLRCPHCGAVNEPAYRFCRECVEPVQQRPPTAATGPVGGGSLFR